MSKGMWFEPIRVFLRRKCNDKWTPRHAANARSWVVDGAITQGSFKMFGCGADGTQRRSDAVVWSWWKTCQ